MALSKVCGAECGIVTAGNASTTNRHWTPTGSPAIETSTVRSGTKSFRFTAAGTRPFLKHTCTSSRTVAYVRLYYRISADPAGNACQIVVFNVAAGQNGAFRLTGDTQSITPQISTTGAEVVITTNEWLGLEAQFDVSTGTSRLKWRTWTSAGGWVSQTDHTFSQTATTIGSIDIGEAGSLGPTSSFIIYMDDVLIGEGTTADEDYSTSVPNGGKVLRYLPSGDLAHSFSNNDFEYNDTTGIASSATDIYTYLDDADQTSIADGFISQNVAGAGKAIRCAFADESTETSPRAVAITSTHHSSGTGANEMHLRVSDDAATWTNVWGDWASAGLDTSDTSAHFLHKVLATKPSGGAWTQGTVNTMRFQWGNSDDVTDIPYLDSVSMEVAWTEVSDSGSPRLQSGMGFFGG